MPLTNRAQFHSTGCQRILHPSLWQTVTYREHWVHRKFQHVFVIADVKQPILGADFRKHFRHKQLIDLDIQQQVTGSHTTDSDSLHPV